MSHPQSVASVKPAAASVFEELARTDVRQWQSVVSRVQDPITARLIVQLLDTMPELRSKRVGIYLAASETVKRDQVRFAKSFRRGKAVGVGLKLCISALTGTTLAIARGLRWLGKTCGSALHRPAASAAAAPGRAGITEVQTPTGLLIIVDGFGDMEPAFDTPVTKH